MEYLDIYDENGNYIGKEDRKIVHEKGIWHKTVHCWLYDKNGNVFYQIRHDRKTLYTTASGHIAAGETIQEGFKREIKEEIGIDLNTENATLVDVVPFKMDKIKTDGTICQDRAFANVYVNVYDGDYKDFNFDPEEVDGLVLVNAKNTLKLFNKGTGYIRGKVIKKDKVINKNIKISDFLINDGETLITKYGDILKKVIEITN